VALCRGRERRKEGENSAVVSKGKKVENFGKLALT